VNDFIIKPKTIFEEKSDELHKKLLALISNSFIFKTIDVEDQGIIIDSMECKRYSAGEFVIRQGEDGSEM